MKRREKRSLKKAFLSAAMAASLAAGGGGLPFAPEPGSPPAAWPRGGAPAVELLAQRGPLAVAAALLGALLNPPDASAQTFEIMNKLLVDGSSTFKGAELFVATTAPSALAGAGSLYYDSAANQFKVNYNNTGWVALATAPVSWAELTAFPGACLSGQYVSAVGGTLTCGTPAGTGVTSVTASAPLASSGGTAPNISLTGTVGVANGGTGLTSLGGANTVLFSNGSAASWNGSPTLSSLTLSNTGANPFVVNTSTFVITNGQVGIGTTSPQDMLDIANVNIGGLTVDGANPRIRLSTTTPPTAVDQFAEASGSGNYSQDALAGDIVIRTPGSRILFNTNNGVGNSTLAINAGNVGIGTASPTNPLTVSGNANVTGTLTAGTFSGSGASLTNLPWGSLTGFPAACSVGQYVSAVGGTLTCGTPAGTGITGSGSLDYLAKFTGAGSIGNSLIYDNGTNVGIGATSPNATLNVSPAILAGSHVNRNELLFNDMYNAGANGQDFTLTTLTSGTNFGGWNLSSDWGGRLSLGVFGSGYSTTPNEYLSIINGGNVGIGNTAPAGLFEVGAGTMTVLSNGNVGIGTTGPRFPLEVTGKIINTAAYNGNSNLNQYDLGVNTIGAGSSIYSYGLICAGNSAAGCTGTGGVVFDGSGSNVYGNTYLSGSGNSYFNGGNVGIANTAPAGLFEVGTGTMTVLSSGNVGIGTAGPGATLDINGPGNGSGMNLRTHGDIMLGTATGSTLFFDGNYSYASGNYIQAPAANTQAFFTAGSERVRITPGGNVGIGTTSPNSALDVGGTSNSAMIQNLATWGLNARTQGLLIMPEGSVTDNGSGVLTFGSTVIIMDPLSGSWERVASGSYTLGTWGYLYAPIPLTGTRGTTVTPSVGIWADADVNYLGRDEVLLAQRSGAGPIYTRFGIKAGMTDFSNNNLYGTTFFGTSGSYQVTSVGATTLALSQVSNLELNNGANNAVDIDAPNLSYASAGRIDFSTGPISGGIVQSQVVASIDGKGDFTAKGTVATNGSPDLAEFIQTSPGVSAGDVVAPDERPARVPGPGGERIRVERADEPYEPGMLGVISDGSSSFLIGSHLHGVDAEKYPGQPLVLAGRVPVKVDMEGGPIHIGDYLTSSSRPGYAMRATKPGATVGIALEDFGTGGSGRKGKGTERTGKILCFVHIGGNQEAYAKELQRLTQENQALRREMRIQGEEFNSRLESLEKRLGLSNPGK